MNVNQVIQGFNVWNVDIWFHHMIRVQAKKKYVHMYNRKFWSMGYAKIIVISNIIKIIEFLHDYKVLFIVTTNINIIKIKWNFNYIIINSTTIDKM